MKNFIRALIPKPLLARYHWLLAMLGAVIYGFPSRRLFVIGVTGTKGKSTTAELVRAALAAGGHSVALASTIRFAVGDESEPNLFKMTMPGRFFLQKFLRRAVSAGCTHAVIEMTSEGAAQFRHAGIALDALIFTNISPEHLESHGGFENYLQAKLSLARSLERSPKRPRYVVANADDPHGKDFLAADVEVRLPFSLKDAEPYRVDDKSARFVWRGELIETPLPGLYNLHNCLAALALGAALGIPTAPMKKTLEHLPPIAGRAERVEMGQPFTVIIDYAHTPDSLRALFTAFAAPGRRLISVIGSTGGGRDTWNRPEKGKIADEFCDLSVITDEDPYDEDPQKILEAIRAGFKTREPRVILDRREAIRAAVSAAQPDDIVLITGKGTDPFIMRARDMKEPWSDKGVAEEELKKLGYH
jgi:UDP-N-acetylmuramoyl-L-alanyl-D-glutamate--2,6-diaminopimelate ligase